MARRVFLFCTVAMLVCGCGGGTSGPESAAVAKWVVGLGGTVRIAGQQLPVRKAQDVPEGELLIEEIDLTDKPVDDAQMQELGKLEQLTRLRLHGTKVGDEGVKHLVGLQGLEEIDLSKTNVTDAGLPTLGGFADLEKILLYNTRVTKEGIEKLQQQLPDAEIFYR